MIETHLTLEELKNKIASYYDEVSILEILNINSFDLVERFSDKIESRYEQLIEEFQGEDIGTTEI